MNQQVQKRIFGVLAFIIPLATYLLTLEPTASFWDCSEFIACAYKLEVGHAPGAPVYMLLGRLFSLIAGGNTEYVSFGINTLSAFASALTVMFLFHIIYWFVGKLILKLSPQISYNNSHLITLLASFIGALSYAFIDSFWFSAVEAEVYATSSLFSALVFWCIIKYDQEPKGWDENRWLVLIFFLLGLSVGIHLLNLLALPAMALVIYFKHYKHSTSKMLITIGLSGLLIATFIYAIIPGVVKTAAYFDLFFVNSLNMPVYFGALFFVILIILGILLMIRYSSRNRKFVLRFVFILLSFWLVGYSSFAILVIRSADRPFIDINNVENIFGLVDYLNREQYPQRPLLYGNNYNSPVKDSKERITYKLYNERYYSDVLNPKYIYDERTLSLFPRMASKEVRHAEAYNRWVSVEGRNVEVVGADGKTKTIKVPTFADNFRFFINYQVSHMYLRYFMWNFVGRQNDTQGFGGDFSGNWISGIPFIDNWRLGNQSQIPEVGSSKKSKNKYYFIPFLIGFLGVFSQLKYDKQNSWVAIILFLFTGPAIVLYLNEVPITPRERDYVHVGSFMVFAIWIGLGAAMILNLVNKHFKSPIVKWIVAGVLLISVPGLLLSENWDDHNRSGRYAARDFGKNMLSSCEQNAILFTAADNDTYPIWYLQQVENFRTDIRQVLTTFLPIDWYGNQMNYMHDGCGKVPISFKDEELLMKDNQYFPVMSHIDTSIDVKDLVKFIKNPDRRTQVQTSKEEFLNFIPGKNLSLDVDAENFINGSKNLKVNKSDLPEKIEFSIEKNYLTRDELLILDVIENNNWKRPIYTVYPALFQEIGLAEYMHREGMVFRLLPYKNNNILHDRRVFANHQYKLITEYFVWGNIDDPKVFLDHTIKQNIEAFRFRQMFVDVAKELISLGENEKAEILIDLAQQVFPKSKIQYGYASASFALCYYLMGAESKGNALVEDIRKTASRNLNHYLQGRIVDVNSMSNEIQLQLYLLQELIRITEQYNKPLYYELVADFNEVVV